MVRLLLSCVLVVLCSVNANAVQPEVSVKTEVVAKKLEHPWSLTFLPDERMLVTERPGRMRIVDRNGIVSAPLLGLPTVLDDGQGGLLDVVLDPGFELNHIIYFSYAEPEGDDLAGTAVARARLTDTALHDLEVIFRQQPKTAGSNHFGSRLVFAKDGTLFITLGERFDKMKEAQNPENHLGTIIRIHPDGTVPKDNPFYGDPKIKAEIWSYGHRNVQGAALHPDTQELWVHEHGPRGGDEINIPKAGKNYGWPKASYGSHYSFIPIKDEHAEQGFEEPIYYWTPSIAPSGMAFYTHPKFPKWQGKLFVGALAKTHLAMLTLDGNHITDEVRLLDDQDYRIREVVQGPDGYLYLLVDDEEGMILKISPVR